MVNLRTLGTVNLLDEPILTVVGTSENGVPTYEEIWERERNTTNINLAQFCKATQPFSFDINIDQTGSWQAILDIMAAIETELNAAAEFSMPPHVGVQIVYREQFGDQAVPSEWNVVLGKVWELRQWRVIEPSGGGPRTRIHVELLCKPGAVA